MCVGGCSLLNERVVGIDLAGGGAGGCATDLGRDSPGTPGLYPAPVSHAPAQIDFRLRHSSHMVHECGPKYVCTFFFIRLNAIYAPRAGSPLIIHNFTALRRCRREMINFEVFPVLLFLCSFLT